MDKQKSFLLGEDKFLRALEISTASKSFVFGNWVLKADGSLMYDGKAIHLPPKESHVLHLLVGSAGSTLSKDMLLNAVWPSCDVHEGSLSRCIYVLRKLFGPQNNFIKSVYGKGYIFEFDVVEYV